MPRFEPFPAVRYSTRVALADVTAPPYDVLSSDEVDALEAQHPNNIVHIDVPRERDGDGRYVAAGERLDEWLRAGVLERDATPTFTIYRMAFEDETQRRRQISGVIGALEVVDEGAGGVLPHEQTTPKAKTDRLDLTRATRANLSPIWGLSLASGLTDLLAEPGEPVGEFMADDGVTHTVERVSDPARLAAIAQLVGSDEVVIADGHHRYAVSRTYRDEQRAATGRSGPWDLTLTFVNELVADQLSVAAIHRVYSGLDDTAFVAALEASFEMVDVDGPIGPAITREMQARGALCLVRRGGLGTFLVPRADAFTGVRDLDSVRLERALEGVPASVTYQHGVGNVLSLLKHGDADAAILIRPVPVAEIRLTAHERLLMPPKSTFFTPKLKTGLVIRSLD
jgi:uncharacterized protein (DUF1015 family)